MNVQKLKESLASTYGSPLLYDGDNGNDEEQKDECSEYKCNINYNSLPSVEAQCEFESCGYAVSQGTNGLEYENTVDYTCKNTQVGILKVTGQPDTCTVELEETVDYVNNTRSEAKGSLLPLGKLSTSPDAFQDMHNLQKFELPINLRLDLSEICCEKTELERTLQLTLDQTDEACEHTEFIQESLGLLFTKHKDMAPSLSLLSCDLSSEMRLRKNSLILSSSEKPMSTSILESSTLPNTSTDVFSVSLQWANNGADCCQSVEQCAKDINYSEVPPHISKEKLLFTKGPEATNQLLELKVNLAACSTPKELNGKVLETPCAINDSITINDIDTNFVDSLSNLAQAAVIPVLNIVEDDSNAKEENGVHVEQPISKSSCISQSCSSESKDLLNMLSGHTVDDTFLIDSPSFHTDSKAYTSTPLPESKNMTFAVPLLEDSELIETLKKVEDTKDQIKGGGSAGPSGTSKPINKKLSAVTSVTKVKKTEVVSFPKPNFRNVKAKVLSRPALMAKDCLSKPSPRSPQSASNASSPVASPRAPFSAIKSVKRRSVPDQDLKAETVVAKLNKQPINKQLSPSQLAHAPTHTKYALGKVPRTAVLKQTQDDVERTSSSNSTRSSGSAAALTCTTSSRVSESKGDKAKTTLKPAAVNGAHMGPDTIVQNGLPDADFEKSQPRKENCTSADIFSSAEPFSAKLTAPNKNLHNQLLSSLKTSVSQSVPKARLHSSERRVSLGKNVVIRVSSPPNANQQPAVKPGATKEFFEGLLPENSAHKNKPGGGLGSPKGKSSTVKTSATITTRSLPKSRVPCRASTIQRTSSISSVCSTHSDHSSVSTRSTTGTSSIKTDEVPAKCMRQNGISGAQPAKVTLSRLRAQPLKAAQTVLGAKKSPIANQGVLKSSALPALASKRLETKAVNGVDKGKQKTSPRGPVNQTPTAPPDSQAIELAQCKAICEEQKGIIQQLKSLVTCSNLKFETLTVVIQHLISQREEALKKRKELSQELQNLRGDLVSASSTCDKLEKEKNDLLIAYEGILQKVKDEHIAELSDLEEKLKQFYTGECEKLQGIFIEEAEKYKNELQEKVDDLNTTHETYRHEAEASHAEEIETIKREFEKSLTELKESQQLENKALEDSFKEKQAELEKKIEDLRKENESLKEKLKLEDERKKVSKEKGAQKNPQVMYLEQELESLKAVLEIKNEKLHQQDKKLMQIEKLVETNTTLVERLNKCQQENEDLKARMANHIAISRQLSSEQELLQRSLEKESKANKRLSMENEELLWKLHNGDLCSPKKLSPSSPGIPFHPSRNSGTFSSPTVSPR